MPLFEKGKKNKFFKLWNEILILVYKLHHNLIGDTLTKLEFRLRIYFATIPLRKVPPVCLFFCILNNVLIECGISYFN